MGMSLKVNTMRPVLRPICLAVSLCLMAIALVSSSADAPRGRVCLVLLGGDAKEDGALLAAVNSAKTALGSVFHPVIITSGRGNETAVKEIAQLYGVKTKTALILDDRLLGTGEKLSAALKRSIPPVIKLSAEISLEIEAKNTLQVMMTICCKDQVKSLTGGLVRVFTVGSVDVHGKVTSDVYLDQIALYNDFSIKSGSCHIPMFASWRLPAGVKPEGVRLAAVIYDQKGKVQAVFAADSVKTESAK